MILNIIGIDKVKLFVRLYNYINNNTTFGDSSRSLKSYEEGQQILINKNYDYAHFGIFCNLKNDTVDTNTFNTIYGKGQPVFENIVAELIKELQNPMMPVKFEQIPSKTEQQPSNERKDKIETVQISAAQSFAAQSLPAQSLSAQSLGLSLQKSVPVAGSVPVTGPVSISGPVPVVGPVSISGPVPVAGPILNLGPGPGTGHIPVSGTRGALPLSLDDVMVRVQSWDRFCKLKDNHTIYFQQQPNSGSNHQNPTPGSCGFISLGTTRDAVLKVLTETNQPEVHKFIIEQMELDLLTSHLADPFSFTADHALSSSLKLLHSKLIKAQDDVVAIAARIKQKYWVVTQNARQAGVCKPESWYIKPRDLLVLIQRLSQNRSVGVNQFEILQDISVLTDAIGLYEKISQSLHNALHFPQLSQDYIKKTLPADWMHANIALAWAVATKRTLRLWRHTNILEQSPSIYLFRDSTEAVLELEPGFQDPTPIDILHTSIQKGGLENHYERLIQVIAPELGLAPYSLVAAVPAVQVPASRPQAAAASLQLAPVPAPRLQAAAASLPAMPVPLRHAPHGSHAPQESKMPSPLPSPSPSPAAIAPHQSPSPVVVFSAGPGAAAGASNNSEGSAEGQPANTKTAASRKSRFGWWKKKG